MITNKELYGTDDVPLIPKEIANKRIKLLKNRLEELLFVCFMDQDNNLIRKVQEAITFWEKLRDGDTL